MASTVSVIQSCSKTLPILEKFVREDINGSIWAGERDQVRRLLPRLWARLLRMSPVVRVDRSKARFLTLPYPRQAISEIEYFATLEDANRHQDYLRNAGIHVLVKVKSRTHGWVGCGRDGGIGCSGTVGSLGN